jgi:hypothetical protein
MMSQQVSLFGEKAEEEVVVITTKKKKEETEEENEDDYQPDDKTFEVAEEIKDDKYGWTQLPKDRRSEIGFNFVSLNLLSSTDLSGTRYAVTSSTEHENPRRMLGSMYGSGGETFRIDKLEEIQAFFDNIMESKKNWLQEPYREFTDKETNIKYEHHNVYYDFRLVPSKNFFVIISDKLVEMIAKTGFDFEKWYQGYRDLPEHLATDDDWEKALENLKLTEQGDEIVKKLEAIDKILETNQDLKDTVDFFTKTKEEVIQEFKELPSKLKDISDKIIDNQNTIGSRYHSTPFSWELEHFTGVKTYGKKKRR